MTRRRDKRQDVWPEHVALGRALRELRERRDVSQFALAYDSGLDRTHVNAIECARVNLTFARLRDLLAALDYTLGELAEAYERQLSFIDTSSVHQVVRCPSPEALRAQERHNARALARARAVRGGGRMSSWT
jgi:transcriptional regulator with XRE-family HTH domain